MTIYIDNVKSVYDVYDFETVKDRIWFITSFENDYHNEVTSGCYVDPDREYNVEVLELNKDDAHFKMFYNKINELIKEINETNAKLKNESDYELYLKLKERFG